MKNTKTKRQVVITIVAVRIKRRHRKLKAQIQKEIRDLLPRQNLVVLFYENDKQRPHRASLFCVLDSNLSPKIVFTKF